MFIVAELEIGIYPVLFPLDFLLPTLLILTFFVTVMIILPYCPSLDRFHIPPSFIDNPRELFHSHHDISLFSA